MAEVLARGVRAVAESRILEGLVTWYQRRWEKLRAYLDAREAEKWVVAPARGGASEGQS